MVVSIIATKDLHVLQAAFARVVFQELGVSCVQFKLSWLRLDRTMTLHLGMHECLSVTF